MIYARLVRLRNDDEREVREGSDPASREVSNVEKIIWFSRFGRDVTMRNNLFAASSHGLPLLGAASRID